MGITAWSTRMGRLGAIKVERHRDRARESERERERERGDERYIYIDRVSE